MKRNKQVEINEIINNESVKKKIIEAIRKDWLYKQGSQISTTTQGK